MSDATPPASRNPPAAAPAAAIPWLGLLAVLMGTFISTLNGRLSTFGLADIRGAVHAGFDEGAWITTAQTVAQMLVAPAAVWIGTIFGPRQVLLAAALCFALISLLVPLSPNLTVLLGLLFAGGLASGFFVPLTLSFILRNTAPRYWAYGVVIYALNLELSLNISASLEGWYVDHLSWRWIFWQNAPLAAVMALCLKFGVHATPAPANRPRVDLFGLASGGLGFALLYAGLDQGNRLDWLNSGLVWGLLLAGGVLLAGFFVHEAHTESPLINLKVAFARPLPKLLVLIALLRLTILSTAYLIPLYLGTVRGFRALEVGDTLNWIALPQLIFCPLAGLMLRRVDPRFVASVDFVFVSIACLIVAHGLTPIWGSAQFLPSQLLQAVGQSFALSGVLFFAVLHLRPQDALTFGASVQIARLMGGEIGQAFVVTFARVREQVASNLLGLHVQGGAAQVLQRLQGYAAATARGDPGSGSARAVGLLGNLVRSTATTQAVIDTFVAVGTLTAVALLLAVTHKPAPLGPASARPLFAPRERFCDVTARRRIGTACLVALLAAGCRVGPDYRLPAPPAGADAPLTSVKAGIESTEAPPEQWWKLYNDARLDALLQEAFAANADLAAADANFSAAREILSGARAAHYPRTTASVGGIYGRDATTDEILEFGGQPPLTTWLFEDIFEVSYEIDLFGRVRRSVEAARADAQAVAAARDTLRVVVAAETARTYALICALGEQLAVAHHSLDIVSHEAQITENRHAAGANSEFDVVRSQGLVAQTRASIAPLEGQRRAGMFQLAALLGRTPANAPLDLEICATPPALSALVPVGDAAALLKRRPDVRQAERSLAAATAQIGVATADLYPRISLAGLYGGVGLQLSQLTTNEGLTWGIGPSISWSFPNQALPRARVRQAKATANQALAKFDSVILNALKETEQSLAVYGASLDNRQALLEAQERAHSAFAMAHDQFLAGSLSNLDLLTTEQSLVAADAGVAASGSTLIQNQIAVFKALGGGWRNAGANSRSD